MNNNNESNKHFTLILLCFSRIKLTYKKKKRKKYINRYEVKQEERRKFKMSELDYYLSDRVGRIQF